jgi:accessory colonization factor AcfC
MIFMIDVNRDIVGYRIDVLVTAGAGETISSVSTSYEDSSIAEDSLSPPEVQYQRTFTQVGGYTPG